MGLNDDLVLKNWFDNCGGYRPKHDLNELRLGIKAGLVNEQNEYGMTALGFAAMSDWKEGVEELVRAKADTELRYFRTGETVLHMALQQSNEPIVALLVAGGANPDAANYWGVTPRKLVSYTIGTTTCFDQIPMSDVQWPATRIQNAEHLADHYYPSFKIPKREECESMEIGQSVDLYVFGPKSDTKQDAIKVRITSRVGVGPQVKYFANVETPIEQTHLATDVKTLEFGPENIASVYVRRNTRKK